MYFLLFGFWVLLNGQWTTEIAVVGAIVCAALYAFMVAYMGYSPRREGQLLLRLPLIVKYFVYLVVEVFKSAWATIRLIWSPRLIVQPRVTSFHTRVRTDAGKVVLANSITMTPGTITVDVDADTFLIHCLDDSFDVGQEGFDMEERVMQLENGMFRPLPVGSAPVQPASDASAPSSAPASAELLHEAYDDSDLQKPQWTWLERHQPDSANKEDTPDA